MGGVRSASKTLEVPTVLGTVEKYKVPGKAVFERGGKTYEVLPVLETVDARQLFLIFADKTSGKETYGAGRFLYADMRPRTARSCSTSTRPTTRRARSRRTRPARWRRRRTVVNLRVDAGEKKYKGSAH